MVSKTEKQRLIEAEWSISLELFEWIRHNFSEGERMLVFGNGVGTELLAAHYQIVCVEHDEAYLSNPGYEKLLFAPLVNGEYDKNVLSQIETMDPFPFVLIDGPPGNLADRSKLLTYFSTFWKAGALIAIDDTDRDAERNFVILAKREFDCFSETVRSTQKSTTILSSAGHILNDLADRAIVVSLVDRNDRRRHVRRNFAKQGIRFEWFDGIRPTAHDIRWTEMRHLEAYGSSDNLRKDYVIGAVGCKRSAIAAMEHFLEGEDERLLLLQDDCQWIADSDAAIRKAWPQLPSNWDMVYFSSNCRSPSERVSKNIVRLRGARLGTAILFKRSVLPRLVDGLRNSGTEYDVFMQGFHEHSNAYCIDPMPAFQKPTFSDIVLRDVAPENCLF